MSCMHSEEEHLLNKYPSLINCAGKRKSLSSSRQLLLIKGDYFNFSRLISENQPPSIHLSSVTASAALREGGATGWRWGLPQLSWREDGVTPLTTRQFIAGPRKSFSEQQVKPLRKMKTTRWESAVAVRVRRCLHMNMHVFT